MDHLATIFRLPPLTREDAARTLTYTRNDKLPYPTSGQPETIREVVMIALRGRTGGSLYTLAGQHEDPG